MLYRIRILEVESIIIRLIMSHGEKMNTVVERLGTGCKHVIILNFYSTDMFFGVLSSRSIWIIDDRACGGPSV